MDTSRHNSTWCDARPYFNVNHHQYCILCCGLRLDFGSEKQPRKYDLVVWGYTSEEMTETHFVHGPVNRNSNMFFGMYGETYPTRWCLAKRTFAVIQQSVKVVSFDTEWYYKHCWTTWNKQMPTFHIYWRLYSFHLQ